MGLKGFISDGTNANSDGDMLVAMTLTVIEQCMQSTFLEIKNICLNILSFIIKDNNINLIPKNGFFFFFLIFV